MKLSLLLLTLLSFNILATTDEDEAQEIVRVDETAAQLDEMLEDRDYRWGPFGRVEVEEFSLHHLKGAAGAKVSVENMRLSEKPEDKNLAPVVVIVNRAPHGTAADAQTMRVYQNGELVKESKISTGLVGHATPVGYFRPAYTNHMRIYRNYYSATYDGAPMTWAVFFNGGVALHSTPVSNYKNLGKRASHGCVRMTMEDAEFVNALVRDTGTLNPPMVKWQHDKFRGKLNNERMMNSVDTVIVIKDERTK